MVSITTLQAISVPQHGMPYIFPHLRAFFNEVSVRYVSSVHFTFGDTMQCDAIFEAHGLKRPSYEEEKKQVLRFTFINACIEIAVSLMQNGSRLWQWTKVRLVMLCCVALLCILQFAFLCSMHKWSAHKSFVYSIGTGWYTFFQATWFHLWIKWNSWAI